MEHEVNVPFSVGSVRAALSEPERVVRCVPGLQLDDAEGAGRAKSTGSASATAEGRLRVRAGGSTITYRGTLTLTPRGEEFAVKGSGTEARGSGSVRLNLTVVPRRAEDGEATRLVCKGTVKAGGRIEDVEPKTAASAGTRLLERFAKALGDSIRDDPPKALDSPGAPAAVASTDEPPATEPSGGIGEPDDNERAIPGIPGPDSRESRSSGETSGDTSRETSGEASEGASAGERAGTADGAGPGDDTGARERPESQDRPDLPERKERKERTERPESPESPESPERPGVFETDVPPSSLGDDEEEEAEAAAETEAEAAHARRTMIGRSAEEVDHAPPRGRYSPIPVPEPIARSAALRWVAPATAAVVAGAVVIGRALRRRR